MFVCVYVCVLVCVYCCMYVCVWGIWKPFKSTSADGSRNSHVRGSNVNVCLWEFNWTAVGRTIIYSRLISFSLIYISLLRIITALQLYSRDYGLNLCLLWKMCAVDSVVIVFWQSHNELINNVYSSLECVGFFSHAFEWGPALSTRVYTWTLAIKGLAVSCEFSLNVI